MKVLVLVASYFPYGVAISTRMVNFCRLFSSMGNDVHVISLYSKEQNINTNTIYNLDYCTYQIVTNRKESSRASFLGEKEFTAAIDKYVLSHEVDIVFSSGIEPYYRKIQGICKKNNLPFYLEQCEWMDVSSYKFGKLDYRFIRRNRLITGGYKSATGIIAITNLLLNHFRSLGIRTVRIPTILDVKNIKFANETYNDKYTLIYTGNPSTSKEFLAPVINLLAKHKEYKDNFVFHIYGPNEEKVIANIGGKVDCLKGAGDSVIIHGRVPQEEMENIQRNADFQIFIRPHRRSSDAGFPTKLGESMTVGTPVISNDTGDIAMYLKDGYNGYLMKDGTEEELENTLKRILALSKTEYSDMRKNARFTAESVFEYSNYHEEIKQLFGWEEI